MKYKKRNFNLGEVFSDKMKHRNDKDDISLCKFLFNKNTKQKPTIFFLLLLNNENTQKYSNDKK